MTHFASAESAKNMYRDLKISTSSGEVIHKQGIFLSDAEHTPSKFWIFSDPLISWSGDKAYYWGIQNGADGLVYTTVDDVTDIIETRNHLIKKSLLISSIGLIFIIGLGYLFARYALSPIEKMQSAAKKFSIGERGAIPHVGIYGNIKDEVVLLAQSLEELFARVNKEAERLEQFSDDIAHEIKNRLFEMQSSLEIGIKTKNYESSIKKTQHIIQNLSHLVDALLFFSRNEVSDPKPTNIYSLIRPLIDDEYQRIKLTGDKNITWDVFPDLFQTALSNIINNAQKFTPSNGSIEVILWKNEIEIKDSGIGISAEDSAHIFERFYKREPSSKTVGKSGHWLGLSITKKIIEDLHGMKLWVISQIGSGSSFIIKK